MTRTTPDHVLDRLIRRIDSVYRDPFYASVEDPLESFVSDDTDEMLEVLRDTIDTWVTRTVRPASKPAPC